MTLAPVRPALHRAAPELTRRQWQRPSWLVDQAQLAAAVGLFHVAVRYRSQGSATLLALAFLLLVPGRIALRAMAVRPANAANELVLTVSASIGCLLATVLGVRAAAPTFHLVQPLATGPLLVGIDLLMLGLTIIAALRRQPIRVALPSRLPASSALLLIPVVAGFGTEILENRHSMGLLVTALLAGGCALVWAFFQARKGNQGRVLTVLFCVTLSLLWSYSLRSKGLYGFDVQEEFGAYQTTAHTLAWNPVSGSAYSAMLSITALPTMLWQLTGLSGMDSFKLLFPVLFSLYPLGIMLIARRWLRPVPALVCTCLLFLTANVAAQMPALGRQEVALLLFVGVLLAAFDPSLPRRAAQPLALFLGLAMVVSHYSTAYVALGAFFVTRVVSLLQRLFRQRAPYRAVIGLPVVLILIAWSAYWTVDLTKSGQNVGKFAGTVSANGAQVLPNSHQSLLIRWLAGNVTDNVAPQTYFDTIDANYATTHTWIRPYPKAVQAQFPAVASSAPVVRAWQPGSSMPWRTITTVLRQGTNLAIAVGALAMAFLIRRRRLDPELSAMAMAMFVMSVVIRVSGSASFAYNPERFAMQSAAVLVVPLGLMAQLVRRRMASLHPFGRRLGVRADTPQRAAGVIAVGLLTVLFLDSSGLAARAIGGSPPGNLSTAGEYVERFHASSQDIAGARWLATLSEPNLLLYADRYGLLTVQSQQITHDAGLLPDIAPGTLDQRGLVFASTTNIIDGRARGTTPDDQMSSTYEFPRAFLDTEKAVIFDTGWTRIYK